MVKKGPRQQFLAMHITFVVIHREMLAVNFVFLLATAVSRKEACTTVSPQPRKAQEPIAKCGVIPVSGLANM